MAIVAILGLAANSMSLVVLTRPKIRETSFNQLLSIMCIVDSLFISCNILSCLQALGIKSGSDYYRVIRGIMDAFAQVWMCSSVLMIVALTLERHFAIRSPHRVSYLGPLNIDLQFINTLFTFPWDPL